MEPGRALSAETGSHLKTCADCRAFHEERLALQRMIAGLEVVTAPADFDFRLRARLATVKSGGSGGGFPLTRFAPGAWSMGLAASFVLLIALGLIFNQAWLPTRTESAPLAGVRQAAPLNVSAPSFSPTPVLITPQETAPGQVNHVQTVETVRPRNASTINPERREAVASATAGRDGIESNDSVVRPPPPQVTPLGIPDPLTQPTTMSVPVQTAMKPTTITFNDKEAKQHNVSLRPVTFGAQDMFEQGDAQKLLVQTAHSIW